MEYWEATAVVFGIAYLVLAVMQRRACWYAAFVSSGIFLVVFWDVSLLMESALQIYYLLMAVYGWWQWQHGGEENGELAVRRWALPQHAAAIICIGAAALVSGWLLQSNTTAAMPYIDSFTTWGAVFTTWMVTQKILENWLYWLVIDAVSIYLYMDRELYLTAALFVVYILIALFGYRQWLQTYRAQTR
jgi:nicotinamide mononucleotide transporter